MADFHPKGAVAEQYGIWRSEKGYSRRAVFIVDPEGVVQYSEVILKGPPDTEALLEKIDRLREN